MSQHVGPPTPPGGPLEPAVPEPSFAERARTLVHLGRTGALATVSRRHPGHPFASVMPYAPDPAGRPLLLISSLAMHTQNLRGDPRASLLVTEALPRGETLAAGRVTLMGEATPLSPEGRAEARAAYLERHASAAYWVDFEDFAFFRLEVTDVYMVGGFAAMDWVSAEDYRTAPPDPLAEAAPGILEHMNRDHADALITLARGPGRTAADEATLVGVDRLGFKLRIKAGDAVRSVRIAFPRELRTANDAREAFIAMLREARARA
jgi:putative heme iron utilization protein